MASNLPLVVNAPAAQWSADTYQVDSGGTSVQLAAADPQRRAVCVYTDPNSLGVLYLNPTAGVSAGGIRLTPGAGFEFEHAGAIYGRAVGGDVLANVYCATGSSC